MTPKEVKKAHDKIWAVREKIGFCEIKIVDELGRGEKFLIQMLLRREIKVLDTYEQVEEFLWELKMKELRS